jgi:hypothetical protein
MKRLSMNRGLSMTHEDAVALVAVSLEAIIHRRHLPPAEGLRCMPVGLLRVALDQLDKDGANSSAIRAEFMQEGFNLSAIPHCADAGERCNYDDNQSVGELTGSRVPNVIAAAILAKYHEGWSKSRIAREFRLNRRTVIRICAGG